MKMVILAAAVALFSACSAVPTTGPAADQLVASPCALPNPQPGVKCDGYRINP